MSVLPIHTDQDMARLSEAPKFAAQTRVLVLANRYFFDESWVRSARELGWQAASLPAPTVDEPSRLPVEKLVEALVEFRPDFVLTSNYGGVYALGHYARMFEKARIPCVSWFTDTPRMLLHDLELHITPYSVAATWERAYMPHLRKLGFAHVVYLPLATDPQLFNAPPRRDWARTLAFVGSSMAEPANQAWRLLEDSPELRDAVANALDNGRVTRDLFAHGLEAVLGVDVVRKHTPRARRHAELCLLYEWTRRQRRLMLEWLVPFGVEVRGDPGWSGCGAHSDGQVDYFNELAGFYGHTAINLNVTSLQMKSAVNQRVFDCPAAGGFLITDGQSDINELFEEDEVVTYRSLEELVDRVRFYRDHPAERQLITERARERVLAHHTHRQRLQSLESFLRSHYSG